MFSKHFANQLITPIVLFSGVIVGFIYGTSPQRIGPTGVTLFFVAVYFWSFFVISLVVRIFSPRHLIISFRDVRHFVLVAILAGIPTMLLALSSLGQLALRDVLIIVSLTALIVMYWIRRR